MPNFSECLWVQGTSLTFYFHLITVPKDIRYCVSVDDVEGTTYTFIMRKSIGKWILLNETNQYPLWIANIEEELSSLIALKENSN